MGRFPRRALGALVLSLALAASGCMGVADGRGAVLPGWPPPPRPRPMAVDILAVMNPAADRPPVLGDKLEEMRQGVARAWADCPGVTVAAAGGPGQAWDRRMVVTCNTKQEKMGLTIGSAFWFGFSGTLLPAIASFKLQLTAGLFDSDGKDLGTYFEEGHFSVWMGLLLLPVWPFRGIPEACEAESYELTRRIILEAMKAGAL